MKKLPALIAAILTTLAIGLVMLVIGFNAIFTTAKAQAAAPADASSLVTTSNSSGATIQQLNARIAEYQAREQQYQDQINQLNTSLQQTNGQLMQYQQLVTALQANGLIQITQDGQVFIRGGR
jgi:septal ring factor EnvC (AmiA/AmiB activator)